LFEAATEPANAVMIGDTSFDMQMARNANVRAIGVAWGYHEPHELTATGADMVAQSVAELNLELAKEAGHFA
jgi:phosphoglycolate phosphatase